MTQKYLPNDSWKYQQSLYSNFNNNLLSGISSGLSLYSPEEDIKLYKPLDYKTLDNLSFDDINKKIDENNSLFNNAKSIIEGTISGTAAGGSDGINIVFEKLGVGINKFANEAFGFEGNGIYIFMGLFLTGIIIIKKI